MLKKEKRRADRLKILILINLASFAKYNKHFLNSIFGIFSHVDIFDRSFSSIFRIIYIDNLSSKCFMRGVLSK